jgi:hypothetical protein
MKIGSSPEKLQAVTSDTIEGVIDKLTAEITGSITVDHDAAHGGLVDKPMHLSITGPKLPNLTLVDLPGKFFAL